MSEVSEISEWLKYSAMKYDFEISLLMSLASTLAEWSQLINQYTNYSEEFYGWTKGFPNNAQVSPGVNGLIRMY